MKKRKTIPMNCLPMKPPVIGTIAYYLLLEHLKAPGWAWGAMGLLIIVGWIVWIMDVINRDDQEIFK